MSNVFTAILTCGKWRTHGFNQAKNLLNLVLSQANSKDRFFSKGSISYLANKNNSNGNKENQLPTLFCIQNPISWLINKFDFKMLKSAWDSDFDEEEFKRGTKQAVAVICTLISKNLWDSLRGLVTRQALTRLRRDVEVNWSDEQRRNINMTPEDIKHALPIKVHFLRVAVNFWKEAMKPDNFLFGRLCNRKLKRPLEAILDNLILIFNIKKWTTLLGHYEKLNMSWVTQQCLRTTFGQFDTPASYEGFLNSVTFKVYKTWGQLTTFASTAKTVTGSYSVSEYAPDWMTPYLCRKS